jgi:hypothetical protein
VRKGRYTLPLMKTEQEKLHSLLERRGATSLMNNTKWREALEGLAKLPLRYRIKYITGEKVSDWTWLKFTRPCYIELGYWAGISRVLEVEWLEVDTLERKHRGQLLEDELIFHTTQVQDLLSALRVPFSIEESVIRIQGHLLGVE